MKRPQANRRRFIKDSVGTAGMIVVSTLSKGTSSAHSPDTRASGNLGTEASNRPRRFDFLPSDSITVTSTGRSAP